MEDYFKSLIGCLLLLLAISCGEENQYSRFDQNGDGAWNLEEFSAGFEDNFGAADANEDEFVDNQEFVSSTFTNTDTDQDGFVDADEWTDGRDNIFGDYIDNRDFGEMDQNQDGDLDNEEWNAGFEESGWFEAYDRDQDGTLTSEEWQNGTFNDWDANDDDVVDQEEYQANI